MRETEIGKTQDGRLVLRPSARAQKRRAARARLEGTDPAHVRETAMLPELRGLLADLLEWLQEGGEASA